MVARGWDLQLPTVLRAFVYLPYEHCENLPTQEEALRLFERVLDDPQGAGLLDWARKHHEVIRFVPPDEFKAFETTAYAKGFLLVSATPLTRSSHHAGDDFAKLQAARAALTR